MERITGIGGIFFRARDAERLRAWYRDNLGIELDPSYGGASFTWREPGCTVWSVFADDSRYFPGAYMLNYRVRDLTGTVSLRLSDPRAAIPTRLRSGTRERCRSGRPVDLRIAVSRTDRTRCRARRSPLAGVAAEPTAGPTIRPAWGRTPSTRPTPHRCGAGSGSRNPFRDRRWKLRDRTTSQARPRRVPSEQHSGSPRQSR